MSYIKIALLWCAAACIALWAYLRLRRGKVTLLEGRFSPGLVRMIAIILVYLNGGCPEPRETNVATAKPQASLVPVPPTSTSKPTPTPTPTSTLVVKSSVHAALKDFPTLDVRKLYQAKNNYTWPGLIQHLDAYERDPSEANLNIAKEYIRYISPEPLRDLLQKKIERKTDTLEEICDLLDMLEKESLYDSWMAAYLWRSLKQSAGDSATPNGGDAALALLLERLRYHHRVLHSLMLAEAEVGPVTFVPWRSKAAAPKGYSGLAIPAGLLDSAKKKFPTTDAATWDSEATLSFAIKDAPASAVFFVAGSSPSAAGSFVLTRFSLVSVPKEATSDVILTHKVLGELTIKPGQTLTAWNVEGFLPTKATKETEALIEKAMKGDAKALTSLESMLPAAQGLIRKALEKSPSAKGAPSLRTLLSLFDE
jgi:hypothetical protein